MMRITGTFFCLIFSASLLAADYLATARYYYVDFQTNIDVGDCRDHLLEYLEDELVDVTEKKERADAYYVVNIEAKRTGLRDSLAWHTVVFTRDNQVIFETHDDEAGWNPTGACIDAAADMAEDLSDRIKEARVNRGKSPGRIQMVSPATRPIPTVMPTEPIPPRQETRPLNGGSGRQQMKERAIGEDVPMSPDESGMRVKGKWTGKASVFAQAHGCSDKFIRLQSLPSGAEIYTTTCGNGNHALITCSSSRDCELGY